MCVGGWIKALWTPFYLQTEKKGNKQQQQREISNYLTKEKLKRSIIQDYVWNVLFKK